MIRINLLSKSDKLEIKIERTTRLLISSFAIIISVQLFFLILLFLSMQYMLINAGELDKQLESAKQQKETMGIEKIESNIEKNNRQLKHIYQIQRDQVYLTNVLENFSQIIPSNVKINSVNIKQKDVEKKKKRKKSQKTNKEDEIKEKSLFITGTAKTRDDLLEFENALKESDIFSDLIIDLANYDDEKNVNFKYEMTINAKTAKLN